MGGNAFLITGKLTDAKAGEKPSISDFGSAELAGLPIGPLDGLRNDFKHFLKKAIPKPHAATKSFLNYLDIPINIYVRSERKKGSSDFNWYVQFTFSGCAGMAEVSADLGVHWACRWYQENSNRLLKDFFEPFGFVPDSKQDLSFLDVKFIPMDGLGYAEYDLEKIKAAKM